MQPLSNIKYHSLPAKNDSKFSIIIPSWNNLEYLKLCIGSIRKNSRFSHQIVVHVNEGIDGTLDWIKSQHDIEYTHSEINIGVCYALNCTRRLINTNYVLYINDDMYACPDWDYELWREVESIGHNRFFLSATAIEPVSHNSCIIEKDYGKTISEFDEKKLLEEYAQLPMNDWKGSTWPPNIVHVDIWDAVGGYSIEYSPGMYSDPDFSMKLWYAGVRLFKGVASSRVYHFGSISVKRVKKNKGYYTFIAKWGMTSSTFTKYYLQRGLLFDGESCSPQITAAIKIKNLIKRLYTAWKWV